MNKTELISEIATAAGASKELSGRIFNATLDTITHTLKKGDAVSLTGFGTFEVRHREARQGRNPQTGQTMTIKATNVPAFRAGKTLKDSVQ